MATQRQIPIGELFKVYRHQKWYCPMCAQPADVVDLEILICDEDEMPDATATEREQFIVHLECQHCPTHLGSQVWVPASPKRD